MNILCVNTAFAKADIALNVLENNYFESIDANAKTSENVLPAIEKLLFNNKLLPTDISCAGVVVGPGSFTGLRIGVALVKGFACANKNLKIVAVNSLDLMAQEFVENFNLNKNQFNGSVFYCVLNALSGRFFVAKFNADGSLVEHAKLVKELPENAFFVGLEEEGLDFVNVNVELSPQGLLEAVKLKQKSGQFVAVEHLEPLYLRLSQAEENCLNNKLTN